MFARRMGLLVIGLALLLGAPTTGSDAPYLLALAKLLSEEGAFQEATEHFGRAVEVSPDDPFIRIEYAKLLMRVGRAREAEEHAEAALLAAPGSLDAMRIMSQVSLELAEQDDEYLDRARELLEQIRIRNPDDVQSMIALGQVYLSQMKYEAAAKVFREALSNRPGNRTVYSFLIDALLRGENTSEAEEVLREVLQLDPSFTRARLALAELESDRGDHASAAATLRDAPEEAAGPDIRQRLALELYRSGELDRALTVLEEQLERQPEHFGSLYMRALILAAQGRNEETAELARRLMTQRPNSAELASLLARALERERKVDEASQVLEEAAERLRSSSNLQAVGQIELELARLLARSERWSALLDLTESLREETHLQGAAELLALQADALFHLDRWNEALDLLARYESNPDYSRRVWAKEAEILLRLGRDQEADERVEELTNPGDVENLLYAAEVYQRLERYAEAIPILEQALRLKEESIQVMFWLGAAYERSGRLAEAEELFEDLLEVEPDFAPALNYLGYMWAEQGEKLDQALVLVRQAVTLDPDNGAYADSLGWTHYQLGQYEEAQDHLERAVELVGDDAVVFEHLGDLYVALGRLDEARELYRRALALEAGNAEAVRRKLDGLSERF